MIDETNFEDKVKEVLKKYSKSSGFKDRKLTDTPIDNLQIINKKYCDGVLITNTDGAIITFNLNQGKKHTVVLGDNRTLVLTGGYVGQVFLIRLVQDGTGSRTVTWFSTIKWAGGSAPTLTTTLNKADVFGFLCTSEGNYDGFVIGTNI